ncbi:MAG: GtrA family protein [Oscillospiraceae bacterium]|nr:GtrA family protein [Oscillospiraceae bacterium]
MAEKKNETVIQAIKFVLFSMSAGVIQVLVFNLLTFLFGYADLSNEVLNQIVNANYGLKYIVALVCSVVWNFTFNRKFTFKSANNIPVAMLKVLAYYAVFTPVTAVLGTMATNGFGWTEPGDWRQNIVLGVTMLLNITTEFVYDKYVVFKESKPKEKENEGDESANEIAG